MNLTCPQTLVNTPPQPLRLWLQWHLDPLSAPKGSQAHDGADLACCSPDLDRWMAGRAGSDDLVFINLDGTPMAPDTVTAEWARAARTLKLRKVTLHALRHTHASQLVAAGLDVDSVSRRLGLGNPAITLNTYAHLFGNPDDRAAEIVAAAMATALAD